MEKQLVFPDSLTKEDNQNNYVRITFYKHTANKNTQLLNEQLIYPIVYLPLSTKLLVESISANYSIDDIGILGNVLYANIREYGISAGGLATAFKNTIDNATINDGLEGFINSALLRTDSPLIRAGAYAEGIAYNPNNTAFFQGSSQQYRLFYFNLNLFPKSKEEAITLKEIEKTFLKNSLPSVINNGVAPTINYNNHYLYPSKLQLEIFVDGEPYNKFKFLPLVITRVDISHNDSINQNEMVFFEEDGVKYFTSTTINLTLQETKVFTRKDIDEVHQLN